MTPLLTLCAWCAQRPILLRGACAGCLLSRALHTPAVLLLARCLWLGALAVATVTGWLLIVLTLAFCLIAAAAGHHGDLGVSADAVALALRSFLTGCAGVGSAVALLDVSRWLTRSSAARTCAGVGVVLALAGLGVAWRPVDPWAVCPPGPAQAMCSSFAGALGRVLP